MTEVDALTLAACIIAGKATPDQVEMFMDGLSQPERAQVMSGIKSIIGRLPALTERFTPSLAAIPLPMNQPVEGERWPVLLARLNDELADVEALLQAARRAGEEGAVNVLLDWRTALSARRAAVAVVVPVGQLGS